MIGALLVWALAISPEAAHGAQLFQRHCMRCHGAGGRGDGPMAAYLEPSPANLSRGDIRYRSTPSGCAPTDQDLFDRLSLGVPGTAMPAFTRVPPRERWALVAYIQSLAAPHPECRPVGTPNPVPAPDPAAGKAQYERLGCASCHGVDGRGAEVVGKRDALGQPLRGSDLTQPATLRGGAKVADLYLRITTGLDSTPMPSYADAATDEQRWQLAVYLASLQVPAHGDDPAPRGRRLLFALGCAYCHGGVRPDGSYDPARRFAGGQVVEVRPLGAYAPGNLTPAGLSGWTDAQIKEAITEGRAPGGRQLSALAMPWPNYRTLSQSDIDELVGALRALPAVEVKPITPAQPPLRERLTTRWRLWRGQPQPLEMVVRPATPAEGAR